MSGVFRIVFSGGILPGFSLDLVRRHARERLKATPEQLVRMFSGRPLVLKKDLDEPSALGYLHKLQELGLDVTLEAPAASRIPQEIAPLTPAQPPVPVVKPEEPTPPTPAATQPAKPQPAKNEPFAERATRTEGWLSETGFADFARTHLNLARAEALLNGNSSEETPVVISSPALAPAATPRPEPAASPMTVTVQQASAAKSATAGLTLSGSVQCPHCGHAHTLQGQVLLGEQAAKAHGAAQGAT
ncbi:hypothetical protein [Uliginosibacterium sp. TH139]|uniref:hypothetical protein n=1 Tax=Uliginosibacterium sp. TH139 TaxID=2067453 RepID=UPI000C7DC4B1|nr:hypothetical protein [Uliginosibacterium sp. TH139]PLK49182.1 hypothetical protein C0V76_08255 [Uliginosibacterium sp. TH139]